MENGLFRDADYFIFKAASKRAWGAPSWDKFFCSFSLRCQFSQCLLYPGVRKDSFNAFGIAYQFILILVVRQDFMSRAWTRFLWAEKFLAHPASENDPHQLILNQLRTFLDPLSCNPLQESSLPKRSSQLSPRTWLMRVLSDGESSQRVQESGPSESWVQRWHGNLSNQLKS